eukprot:g9865.t1
MSCIHLHLGQAGVQLGESFWGLAEEEFLVGDGWEGRRYGGGRGRARVRMHPGGTAMFHEEGGWARCLAVDSEPKVVQRFQGRVGSLRPENAVFSQSGLANNWAMGFASCRSDGGDVGAERGPFSRCMEGMRKEAERSSWLNSVVMTHSLAGGTGSGLGSGLLQALRDEYPSIYLFSACVGPFGTGDTPLQHYNSVLALQHLQAYADCVVYRGNDDLLRGAAETSARSNAVAGGSAQRPGGGGGGGPEGGTGRGGGWLPVGPSSRAGGSGNKPAAVGGGGRGRGLLVSTADMNASFSLDMASCFFPSSLPFDRFGHATTAGTSQPHHHHHRRPHRPQHRQQRRQETAPRPFDGGSLMAAACPLPGAKFVDLRSSLSVGPAAAAAARDGPGLAATTSKKDWAALAADLGRRAPLCPRKGGGLDDDACVAAHHVVRGVTLGPRAEGGWGSGTAGGGAGAASEGGGGGGVGVDSSAAAVALREDAGIAVEALRRHHDCPAWRTATDISCAPALRSQGVLRSVTTVCNQTRIRGVLGDVVDRAGEKFRARAFLHWYYRHGLEDEDFLSAFEAVRSVEREYNGLAKAFGGSGERPRW